VRLSSEFQPDVTVVIESEEGGVFLVTEEEEVEEIVESAVDELESEIEEEFEDDFEDDFDEEF
jgi:hypothetical protein